MHVRVSERISSENMKKKNFLMLKVVCNEKGGGREGGIRCGLVSDVAIDVLFCFHFVRVFSVRYFRFRQVNENL